MVGAMDEVNDHYGDFVAIFGGLLEEKNKGGRVIWAARSTPGIRKMEVK